VNLLADGRAIRHGFPPFGPCGFLVPSADIVPCDRYSLRLAGQKEAFKLGSSEFFLSLAFPSRVRGVSRTRSRSKIFCHPSPFPQGTLFPPHPYPPAERSSVMTHHLYSFSSTLGRRVLGGPFGDGRLVFFPFPSQATPLTSTLSFNPLTFLRSFSCDLRFPGCLSRSRIPLTDAIPNFWLDLVRVSNGLRHFPCPLSVRFFPLPEAVLRHVMTLY